MTEGCGAAGKTGRDLGRHQRDADPTNHLADSITEPVHLPLGTPSLPISPTGPWAPLVLCAPYSHTLLGLVAGSLCKSLKVARLSLY